ncbi:pirin family protein [Alicyclobacillus dauci]|uniref:Pirin family protein n=1 Tax=Alicyclobacillus dauci TaxID=1475485 RepID=A0ABY6Z1I6_9BACL|nr:pirin-like bicupin family protein [Alicyclobacillus dauci]WAH36086.1 pirin family protein [Alicyclobacillus dauci]
MHFGPLRVFNDDHVQPGKGFGLHPHREMEIMTYVIDGVLEHQDSMGNKGFIEPGEVQRMTAGTGLLHSEKNGSDTAPVHFLQIWFMPNESGLTPSWEQKKFTKEHQRNRLLPVVSNSQEHADALRIHQDVRAYLTTLDQGREVTLETVHPRMYVFVISGTATLNGTHTLSEGDTARVSNERLLYVSASSVAQLMIMELA